MSYRQIQMQLDAQTADRLGDALLEAGALSSSMTDIFAGTDKEQIIFNEPSEDTLLWEHSLLLVLFDIEDDFKQILQVACKSISISIPPYTEEIIPDQDWTSITQSQFEPIQISDRLWIITSWHNIPDGQVISIQLNPGLAFGTGAHPTTQLCLKWLDENIKPTDSVLDYGCGSGILAIASGKLGAKEVIGVDIDPQAVQSATKNAKENQVTAYFYDTQSYPNKQYDVVIANILAKPLCELSEALAQHTIQGGRIVLSGILREQAQEVNATYAKWFTMNEPIFKEEWACLTGVRI